MPTNKSVYYLLSHRLRGIVTTYESINYLMQMPGQNTPEIQEKLQIHFEKAKKLAAEFEAILMKRAKTRDDIYQIFLAMISTLYSELERKKINRALMKEELNMFAFLVKKCIEFNRDIENEPRNF